MKANEKQKQALCFYEGDNNENIDPFYRDAKAYVTWNSLLFEGITTEIARSEEGRKLNPLYLEQPDRIIDLSKQILSVMTANKDIWVYRVERLADYQIFKKTGILQSFTSTSKTGFLSSYQDKKDLVLMKIHIPSSVPYADLSEVLDIYEKAEEAEILLPPYLSVSFKDIVMNEEILNIHDSQGNSPAVYCEAEIGKVCPPAVEKSENCNLFACQRVYADLNDRRIPSENDVKEYLQYKEQIRYAVVQWMYQKWEHYEK